MTPLRGLAPEIDLNLSTLIVGGCSYTFNSKPEMLLTWPFYLRDLGGFDKVIDCSYPGAGNKHIRQSLMLTLEQDQSISPKDCLVVVMWSGYDRDDFIVDPSAVRTLGYQYNEQATLGLTGGMAGRSNLLVSVESIKKIKNNHCRAIDNYLEIVALDHYLSSRGFKHVFVEFSTPGTLNDTNFNILDFLHKDLAENLSALIQTVQPTLGDYALSLNQMQIDGYHPSADGHLGWTRNVLLPYLAANLNTI